MSDDAGADRIETVIIGGGQAGLAVGYHLQQRGRPFVILDAAERIGDAWRTRWDTLRLVSPARYDGLPGMSFPAPGWSFPTKDQVADYLAAYAARFDLPVRLSTTVDSLSSDGAGFVVEAGGERWVADNVVVATGGYQGPRTPAFAADLDRNIAQLHSSRYRNPSQLREGGVLVVGAGNSGAEIAFEVSRSHTTWLSGPDVGRSPVRHGSVADRVFTPPFWFFITRVVTVSTPIGRRARPKLLGRALPLELVKPKDLASAGIERVPRTVGVRGGFPLLEDGRTLNVANVIWCTGFRPTYPWLDLAIFDGDGRPVHERGVVAAAPGLYFVGLFFLYSAASSLIGGVGRDAARIAEHIASRDPGNGRSARVSRAEAQPTT